MVSVLSSFCYWFSCALCRPINETSKQNVLQGLQCGTCMDFLDFGRITNTVQVYYLHLNAVVLSLRVVTLLEMLVTPLVSLSLTLTITIVYTVILITKAFSIFFYGKYVYNFNFM
jgi:hypothetical protein